jgi:hypothetical protein
MYRITFAIDSKILHSEETILKIIGHFLRSFSQITLGEKIIQFLLDVSLNRNFGEALKMSACRYLTLLMSNNIVSGSSKNGINNYEDKYIQILLNGLEDDNHALVDSSFRSLIEMFSSKTGADLLSSKEDAGFLSIFHRTASENEIKMNPLAKLKELSSIWDCKSGDVYEWTITLATSLLENFKSDPILPILVPVLKISSSISTRLLPHIVHTIVLSNQNHQIFNYISNSINSFLRDYENQQPFSIFVIIEAIIYLHSNLNYSDFLINIDYELASKAAQRIKNNIHSLMFHELNFSNLLSAKKTHKHSLQTSSDIFRALDSDGVIDPVSTADVTLFEKSMLRRYEHEKSWLQILYAHDSKLTSRNNRNENNDDVIVSKLHLCRSLNKLGLNHIAFEYFRKAEAFSNQSSDIFCESLWRCREWSYNLATSSNPGINVTILFYFSSYR